VNSGKSSQTFLTKLLPQTSGYKTNVKGTGKALLVQPGYVLRAPEGSGYQNLKTVGTLRWQNCQPYAPVVFTSSDDPWQSFRLQVESTPGS
jgi:hypothetical protein